MSQLDEKDLIQSFSNICRLFPPFWVVVYFALGHHGVSIVLFAFSIGFHGVYLLADPDRNTAELAVDLFVGLVFLSLVYAAGLGRLAPMFSALFAMVPLTCLLLGGKHTGFWICVAFICCALLSVAGNFVRPSDYLPWIFPPFTDSYHQFYLLANVISFFFLFSFLVWQFTSRMRGFIEERKRMLATISHEIRTPLHSIRFCAGELAKKPEMRDLLEVKVLLRDSSHLLDLANDVLDLTKMEATSSSQMDPKSSNMGVSLNELLTSIESLATATVEREVAAGFVSPKWSLKVQRATLPAMMLLDRARVTQVVSNFVSNAVKYAGDQGEIVIVVESRTSLPKDGVLSGRPAAAKKYLIFEVRDKGTGLTGQDVSSMFQSFHSGKKEEYLTGRSSLGLGLAICRLNAVRMRGVVGHFVSGGNSIFYLAVPLLELPEDAEKGRKVIDENTLMAHLPDDCTVLAVDDDAMNLMIVRRMLKSLGVKVKSASDQEEALSHLESSRIDILLLDYQLGSGVTGLDVLREAMVRKLPMPRYGTIVVSAHALKEVQDECRRAGCKFYLTKPFESNALHSVLFDVLTSGEKF